MESRKAHEVDAEAGGEHGDPRQRLDGQLHGGAQSPEVIDDAADGEQRNGPDPSDPVVASAAEKRTLVPGQPDGHGDSSGEREENGDPAEARDRGWMMLPRVRPIEGEESPR